MSAVRPGTAVALASLLIGCATAETRLPWARRHAMPPPARESRAGAPQESAGPVTASASSPPALPTPPAPAAPPSGDEDAGVTQAVDAASALVGRRSIVVGGVDYGRDCAALVRAAFASAGRPLPPEAQDAEALHALADRRGALTASRRPRRGDLVFLADRPGGLPAHVGLVARSDPDGTALVLYRVARGVLRVRVNLAYPSRPTDPATGKQINDMLVVKSHAVPAGSLVVDVSDLLRHG